MHATTILKREHRLIERVLTSIEAAAARVEAGAAISPAFFIEASDFAKGFADGCHHKKEEGVLFPAMQAAGIPSQEGPIAVMLSEHQEGRRLVASMRTQAEKLQSGDSTGRGRLVQDAMQYVALLREHIAKEDNILFPMADQVIRGSAEAEVAQAFDKIEQEETGEGVHAHFLALADSLERQVTR